MYWVCEECGWENEYSDEIKYTECQCCGSAASAKNIADATKALKRFHQEEERRKREEAILLKNEKRQQVINGAMAGYIKLLRALPKMNIAATVIAIAVIIGSYITGDTSGEALWNRLGSNIQEIKCFDQIDESFEMASRLMGNRFSSYFLNVGFNNEYLEESGSKTFQSNVSLFGSGIQSHKDSVSDNLDIIGDRWSDYFSHLDANSDMNIGIISTQFTQTGLNLSEVGDHISKNASNFSLNMEFFREQTSRNITELFEKIFKR